MPLSNAQKEFIQGSLCHFIDDTELNREQLLTLIANIKNAFQQTLLESNEFIFLQKYIAQPENYLQRLEKLSSSENKITVGEAQIEMLDYFSQQIKVIADRLNIPLSDLGWEKQNIINLLNASPNFNKEFISAASQFDTSERPSNLHIDTEGRIYDAFLVINREFLIITLSVTLHLDDKKIIKKEIDMDDIEFELEDDDINQQFDVFLQSLLPTARKEAEDWASKTVLTHLKDQDIIDPLTYASPYSKILLTHKFYYDSIRQGQIFFEQLFTLRENQYHTLINHAVMSLLKKNICDIQTAKDIAPSALRMLNNSVYYTQALEKKITLKELEEIPIKTTKLLILPAISNLVGRDKLQLKKIKYISLLSVNIFSNVFFYDKILQNKIDPDFIIQLPNKQKKNLRKTEMMKFISDNGFNSTIINLLTVPFYFKLYKKNKFHLEDFNNESSEKINLLLNDTIKKLIAKSILTVKSAMLLTAAQLTVLANKRINPQILDKTLALEQALYFNPSTSHAVRETIGINNRIHALIQAQQNPYNDSLEKINDTITRILQQYQIEKTEFLLILNKLFLYEIKNKLTAQSQPSALHRSISRQIEAYDQTSNSSPEEILNTIAQLVKHDSSQASSHFFSSGVNLKKLAISEYCAAINALKDAPRQVLTHD
ncbi:MAG: hypothetical protein P4M12_03230 [Gammaproteobacteria bacterium]|nr:hypothetical protein [Gammaproteobacteria bacterium]